MESEVWQNGKVVRKADGLTTALRGPSEASISLQESNDHQGEPKYRIVLALSDQQGYAATSGFIDIPKVKGKKGLGTKPLIKTTDLSAGATVAVWAATLGEGSGGLDGSEPFEEMVKRVEWALLFKLSLENQ